MRIIKILCLVVAFGLPLTSFCQSISFDDIQKTQDSTTTYKIQFLSSKRIDNKQFKAEYHTIGKCVVELAKNGLYQYMVIPKINSLQAANEVLEVVKYDYPDAFVVYYNNGVRFN